MRRWTADYLNPTTLAPNTGSFSQLVSPADYQQQNTLEPSGVTLVRIRGGLSITVPATAGASTFVGFGIFHADANTVAGVGGNLDPLAILEVIKERVLYWKLVNQKPVALQDIAFHFEFDVKAKAKLVNEAIWACWTNNIGGASVTVMHYARALLIGG